MDILKNSGDDVEVLSMPTLDIAAACQNTSCDLCYDAEAERAGVLGLPLMNFSTKKTTTTNKDEDIEVLGVPTW